MKPATVWIITQAGRVVPLADMPPGESAKWWAVEGSSHWQSGEPIIECTFNKLKHYRKIATRYDKKASNFLGYILLCSIILHLS